MYYTGCQHGVNLFLLEVVQSKYMIYQLQLSNLSHLMQLRL